MDYCSTEIPLSQRTTLPVLISYSSTNKQHDPRHPTSQNTAVTRKSSLVHGSSVVYSSTKGVSDRYLKLAASIEHEAKKGKSQAGSSSRETREATPDPLAIPLSAGPSFEPTRASPTPTPSTTEAPPQRMEETTPDPLDDPRVQEGLRIMDWGDDGLGEFTSLEMRMHRGIR
jgi:hypothetical protein